MFIKNVYMKAESFVISIYSPVRSVKAYSVLIMIRGIFSLKKARDADLGTSKRIDSGPAYNIVFIGIIA
ncbi:MAG: hypothetical protein PHW14_04220 [Candidatus Omnitrophica bacterium]|nr:hypothetical protein [Candidatus Omnitrophota bacterium]